MRAAHPAALADGCIPDADDLPAIAGDGSASGDALECAAVRAVRWPRIMQTMEWDAVHRYVGACCRVSPCASVWAAG